MVGHLDVVAHCVCRFCGAAARGRSVDSQRCAPTIRPFGHHHVGGRHGGRLHFFCGRTPPFGRGHQRPRSPAAGNAQCHNGHFIDFPHSLFIVFGRFGRGGNGLCFGRGQPARVGVSAGGGRGRPSGFWTRDVECGHYIGHWLGLYFGFFCALVPPFFKPKPPLDYRGLHCFLDRCFSFGG